jgi:hypothetical protein
MPEEELETPELKEQIDQRIEESLEEHDKLASPKWIKYLSLATAIIAVIAAVASLESGSNSNEAILEKSDAMLSQAQASDQWAFFQAKGVKAAIAAGQADALVESKPDTAALLHKKAADYAAEAQAIQTEAKRLEEKRDESNRECANLMAHHHRFAIAVTLLQIAIALSAIAALTRRKPLWYLGLGVSGAGVLMFVAGMI